MNAIEGQEQGFKKEIEKLTSSRTELQEKIFKIKGSIKQMRDKYKRSEEEFGND